MILSILAWVSSIFAAIPCCVFLSNVTVFRRLRRVAQDSEVPSVSVLIPARNEEHAIEACLRSILANGAVDFEVVVLDDQSDDQTAQRVSDIAAEDPRVRLETAIPLPVGWCGKQHACAQLGRLAKHDVLVFLDADVRLAEDALARIAQAYASADVDLLSGFPRQRTESWSERLMIPLIHFVLLGFLSLRWMRRSRRPAFGAGCGQLFITSRRAYDASGGHAAIRNSLHDGLKLPRLYRAKGLSTDLFDATGLATCRMYQNASEVWHGLKKNATEGVGSAGLIVPVTASLFVGQVLPFFLLGYAAFSGSLNSSSGATILAACILALVPRVSSAIRYQQSFWGALLHPISIVIFLAIQWMGFFGSFSQRPVSWKGRPYPTS